MKTVNTSLANTSTSINNSKTTSAPVFLKYFSGTIAGTVSTLLTQPFDVIKTNQIKLAGAFSSGTATVPIDNQRLDMLRTATNIYKDQGIKGLYRGTVPTFWRVLPGAFIYYNLLNYGKQFILKAKQLRALSSSVNPIGLTSNSSSNKTTIALANLRLTPTESFITAASTRGFTTIVLCPITVVKTRFEYSAVEIKTSFLSTLVDIYKKEGIKGLFSGLNATIMRDASNAGLNFLIYNQTRYFLTNTFYKGKEHEMETNIIITLPSGATGGVLSSLLTHPFDMIRTRQQLQSSSYKGIFDAIRTITKEEGLKTLFRGISARLVKRAFASGITWSILSLLSEI
ncbi:hypothetical protein ABK040_011204 [Willaertia magna]